MAKVPFKSFSLKKQVIEFTPAFHRRFKDLEPMLLRRTIYAWDAYSRGRLFQGLQQRLLLVNTEACLTLDASAA